MSELYSKKNECFLITNKISFLFLLLSFLFIGNLNAKTSKILCGTYTIGGTSPDYATFTAAVAELNSSGVCGPVVFIVRAGTYNERITINQITGASATNTIHFVGENKSTTKITYGATSTTNMSTVLLNGADYITFRDMTIEATHVQFGIGIFLTKQADYNSFRNLNIAMNTASTAVTTAGIAASNSLTSITSAGNNANYNTMDSLTIEGGYAGINIYGQSTTVLCAENTISNCIITNISNYGIRFYYQNQALVKNNTINNIRGNGYGFYFLGLANFEVMANNILSSYIGSYMATLNKNNNYNSNIQTKIYNNSFISTGNVYASYVNSADYIQFYHNTAMGSYTSQAIAYFATVGNADIRNNIFVNYQTADASYAVNISGTQDYLDYNIYYTGGINIAFHGTAQPDLATWKTNFPGTNTNSTVALPNFETANDYHLSPIIPALNAPYVGVSTDIDGDMRCKLAPTIGADESGYKLQAPNGFFVAPDTSFVGSPTRFINTSSINPTEPVKYTWYVDNVEKGSDKNLVYFFQNEISYQVSMKIESCYGEDSVGQFIDLKKPTSIPESDFVAERTVTEMFEDVQLSSVSKHGANSWKWTVYPDDNGSAVFSDETVANPLIAFNYSGIYDICLTTSNDLGQGTTSCKKNYISVTDNLFMCGVFNSSISPAGRITDDGDVYSNYGNNRRCSFVIQPCALSVNLKFNAFDLADAGDSIAIYDGLNNQGNLLGSFSGSFKGLPGGFRGLTALSGVMYIEWTTSASLTAAGFDASWTSIVDTSVQAPTAGFVSPTNVYTGQEASFISTSTGKNIQYAWDFNPPANLGGLEGGKKSTDRYKWNAPGVYNVQLIAANCGGTDTITKPIIVSDITSAPIVNFGATKTRVPVVSQVTLIDSSDQAPTSYKWEITPANRVVYTNSADTSRNPIVYFTAPGLYTVKLKAANALGVDSLTKTSYIEVFSYCVPAVTVLSADIGISRVQFKSIDNITAIGVNPYTSYFENFAPPVAFKRSSFNISIDRKTNTDSMSRKVWIDWNQNGSFNDSGELVAVEVASKKLNYQAEIWVPNNALTGFTIVRIGTGYSSSSNTACGNNPSGEFEDYPLQIVEDNIKPEITLIGGDTLYVEQWHSLNDPGINAIDNLDGDISNLVFTNSNFDSTVVGSYIIHYNVSDNNGNQADEVTRIVYVTPDITPPTITLNGNNVQTVDVFEAYADSGAFATDYFNRSITHLLQTSDNINTDILGVYELIYEVTDAGGNKVTETRTVNVTDATAPVITPNGTDTVYVNVFENLNDHGFTAIDNYDQDSDLVLGYDTTRFNSNITGTYKVTYFATDLSGNKGIKEIVVIVRDTIAPLAELIGKNTIDMDVFGDYIEEGISIVDNYCTNNTWSVSGSVNTEEVGVYTITYTAIDCEGNKSIEITRTVNVLDRQSPVLKLIGSTHVNIRERDSYTDAGVTITDNYYTEDTLRTLMVVNGTVDSTKEGVYTICYNVTDPSGNVSNSVCRIIYVLEFKAGINSQNSNSIQLYPNPNKGEFSIQSETGFINTHLVMYDMLGKMVFSDIIKSGENSYHINVEELPAGMYMLNITDNHTDKNIKISIVK